MQRRALSFSQHVSSKLFPRKLCKSETGTSGLSPVKQHSLPRAHSENVLSESKTFQSKSRSLTSYTHENNTEYEQYKNLILLSKLLSLGQRISLLEDFIAQTKDMLTTFHGTNGTSGSSLDLNTQHFVRSKDLKKKSNILNSSSCDTQSIRGSLFTTSQPHKEKESYLKKSSSSGSIQSMESKFALSASNDETCSSAKPSYGVMQSSSGHDQLPPLTSAIHGVTVAQTPSVNMINSSDKRMHQQDSTTGVEHSIIRTFSSSGIYPEIQNHATSDYYSAESDYYHTGRNSEFASFMASWSRLSFSDFTASKMFQLYKRRHESRPDSLAAINPHVAIAPPKRGNTHASQHRVPSRLKNGAPPPTAAAFPLNSDVEGKDRTVISDDNVLCEQKSHKSVPSSADAHREQFCESCLEVCTATNQLEDEVAVQQQGNGQRLKEGKKPPNKRLQHASPQNREKRICCKQFQQGCRSNQTTVNKVQHSPKTRHIKWVQSGVRMVKTSIKKFGSIVKKLTCVNTRSVVKD